MPLTVVEREIVTVVVHRFLGTKESTSRFLLIKRVKNPDLVDNLVPVILKTGDGENLWPGVLAFECCGDPDALRLARKAAEIVIHALQNLFEDRESEKKHFTIAELEIRARKIFGVIDPQTITLGLYFIQEFNGVHGGLGGSPPNFTSVAIHERIGMVNNIPAVWPDYVAKYDLYLSKR
jgi:hypothetical protein